MLSRITTRIVDLLYVAPFRRLLTPQQFRYAVCGGGNLLLNWLLYFVIHNYIVCKRFFDLGLVVVSPHIATLFIVFPITFLTGFWLNKYVVFKSSPLKTRTQMLRYLLSVAGSFILNYLGLKLFVEVLRVYPTPSQIIVSLLLILYSYAMQHLFTFRGHTKD